MIFRLVSCYSAGTDDICTLEAEGTFPFDYGPLCTTEDIVPLNEKSYTVYDNISIYCWVSLFYSANLLFPASSAHKYKYGGRSKSSGKLLSINGISS